MQQQNSNGVQRNTRHKHVEAIQSEQLHKQERREYFFQHPWKNTTTFLADKGGVRQQDIIQTKHIAQLVPNPYANPNAGPLQSHITPNEHCKSIASKAKPNNNANTQ
jgi:hypothetical protein